MKILVNGVERELVANGINGVEWTNDLLNEALQHDDYEFRINALVAGLVSAESNETPEKEAKTREWLGKIREFCENYTGEHKEYFEHILGVVTKFLEYKGDV